LKKDSLDIKSLLTIDRFSGRTTQISEAIKSIERGERKLPQALRKLPVSKQLLRASASELARHQAAEGFLARIDELTSELRQLRTADRGMPLDRIVACDMALGDAAKKGFQLPSVAMAEMEDVVKLCVWRMVSSVASTLTKVRAQDATQRVCEMCQNVRALAVPFNISHGACLLLQLFMCCASLSVSRLARALS
jgi:hypothetical protein